MNRLIACCLLRRYRSGGLKAILDPRPISDREARKTMATPPSKYDWAQLCLEPEHAAIFEKLMENC